MTMNHQLMVFFHVKWKKDSSALHKSFDNRSIQLFKRLPLDLMNEVFYLCQKHYNLCNFNVFATDNPRNKYLLNSSVYSANQFWQTLAFKVRNSASLLFFKDKSKTWRCDRCQYQISSRHIAEVGFFVTQSWHKAKLHRCKL